MFSIKLIINFIFIYLKKCNIKKNNFKNSSIIYLLSDYMCFNKSKDKIKVLFVSFELFNSWNKNFQVRLGYKQKVPK